MKNQVGAGLYAARKRHKAHGIAADARGGGYCGKMVSVIGLDEAQERRVGGAPVG